MDANDHRHVMEDLDALKQQVASTIQRFEVAGVTTIMKDDYVALHVLEHRIMEMRLTHERAIEA